MDSFSFDFFKDLYNTTNPYKENDSLGCQFFPYKTNFKNLQQVFRMNMKQLGSSWYVGW